MLMTKLIAVIGYGFGDSHINKMLTQGLREDSNQRLFVVGKSNRDHCVETVQTICSCLEVDVTTRVHVQQGSAEEFMETPDLANLLLAGLPKAEDAPFRFA